MKSSDTTYDLIGVIEENAKWNCNKEIFYHMYIWSKQDANIIYERLLNMQEWYLSISKVGNFIIIRVSADSPFKDVLLNNDLFFICNNEVRWT